MIWRGTPGRDALEGADQPGQGDLRRVMREQVHVVAFAVELDQLCREVSARREHDFFAARQDLVRERATPVPGREDQVSVKGVDNGSTRADVGFGSQRVDMGQPS